MSIKVGRGNIYDPSDSKFEGRLYDQVLRAYPIAFADEPWCEVSKCPAVGAIACVGGLSSVQVGELCGRCNLRPTEEAYPPDKLKVQFGEIAQKYFTAWYIEEVEDRVALSAMAWRAQASIVAAEKYPDVPEMAGWLAGTLGEGPLVWLDEVFANKRVRASGNLADFTEMYQGFGKSLGPVEQVAFRTISPAMRRAAQKAGAVIYSSEKSQVPDRRDFVVINV